jgi:beta-galactosidase
VSQLATVWLNAHKLGTHASGTSAFAYDVSEILLPGEENLLAVRADNSVQSDLPPLSGDFTLCGGIHREVSLVQLSSLAVDALDYASPGVYLTAPELSPERGLLRARVRVRNSSHSARPALIHLSVQDADGRLVAATSQPHLAPPDVSEVVLTLAVTRPTLWQGRSAPYLYRVRIEIGESARTTDRIEQAFGFRSFTVDPERGFLLNGRPYELHGAALHQDFEGKGWAISRQDRERDFQLLMELGATFVRLVHYQHDPHAYELADRLGLLVWAEHALVNQVSPDPVFAERASVQLTELIRQGHNHPSIVVWGIGNEVQPHQPPAVELLKRLSSLVKREDPSRPSALATCFDEPAGAYGVELLAHNKYFGWYLGKVADFPVWLDAQRAKNRALPMGISEYGAGAGIGIHSADPEPLDHSEEYQSLFHEAYWRALRERSWLWCKVIWNLFDFASAGRKEGERLGINDKGLVTRDRSIKKDAFYWYQANWTEEPMVHLTGRRFSPRYQPMISVKAYSNCELAELFVGDRGMGRIAVIDHVAHWPEVALELGENRVRVTAYRGNASVCDACTWVRER